MSALVCFQLRLHQTLPLLQPHLMQSAVRLRLCSTTGKTETTTTNTSSTTNADKSSSSKKVTGPPELQERKWQLAFHQKENGVIAGKLPVKITLQKGKKYIWCLCGHSKTQPLCDNTHYIQQLRIKLRPLVFHAPEDMDVWLCTCKQTKNRPFCDGSHRSEEVQAFIKR